MSVPTPFVTAVLMSASAARTPTTPPPTAYPSAPGVSLISTPLSVLTVSKVPSATLLTLASATGPSSSKRMLPPRSRVSGALVLSPSPSVTVAVALKLTLPLASAVCRSLPTPRWSSSALWVRATVPLGSTLRRKISPAGVLPMMSPLSGSWARVTGWPSLVRPELASLMFRL